MDQDQDDIPAGVPECCPKHHLSGAEFKEATEENPHEQQNVKSFSKREFQGDTEEQQRVMPQNFKQLNGDEFKEGIKKEQNVPQNVKQLNGDEFKEGTEEEQNAPQNVKRLNGAEFKEDSEEKQNVPQNVKRFNRAEFEEDSEEKQSVPQNIKRFNRAALEEDSEKKQSMPQNTKQLKRAALEEDIKGKQTVRQLIKKFSRPGALNREDIEENPNECQNFLNRNTREKRTEGTQIRTIQCIRHQKFSCCGLLILISIILILLCVLLTFIILYAKNCDLNSPAHSWSPCPHYWIGYEGNCYFFSREKQTWASSQNFCSLHNSSLARIESEEDKDFVMILKGKGIYWIGLQRRPGQPWAWTNGENSRLEVIEGGGNCAYLDNEAKAVSSGCHKILPWICSKPATYT